MSQKSVAQLGKLNAAKVSQRETNRSLTRQALQRVVDRRIVSRGELDFPCVPSFGDRYVAQLTESWRAIGRAFAAPEVEDLRKNVAHALATGFAASPYARMIVSYEAPAPPQAGVHYIIRLKEHTMEEHYRRWVAERNPPLFGVTPDCKVLSVARELGPPENVCVLDVGAGTGRNAIALARLGYATDALEPVPALVEQMRNDAAKEGVSLDVIEGDILSPQLSLAEGRYRLIVLAEVISYFRSVEQVRIAFTKFASALAPGGVALVNSFLAMEGYKPDDAAREVSETAWSRIFTRGELAFINETLPFDRVAEESVYDYEKRNAPTKSWPPTGWFEDWSQGRNVFDLPSGRAPIDMRWLVYRRR
jgi:SAM-dependent methyltransferase